MNALVVLLAVSVTASALSATHHTGAAADPHAAATISRGRYLVVYGGCNNCHTPGWRASDGMLPQSKWLTGSRIGFRGDWGTSYPANVRLEFANEDESQWVIAVRTRGGHPPMVWHDLRVLTPADRHAIFAFIKSLGPSGMPAPAALPPWREPSTPYIETRPRSPRPTTR